MKKTSVFKAIFFLASSCGIMQCAVPAPPQPAPQVVLGISISPEAPLEGYLIGDEVTFNLTASNPSQFDTAHFSCGIIDTSFHSANGQKANGEVLFTVTRKLTTVDNVIATFQAFPYLDKIKLIRDTLFVRGLPPKIETVPNVHIYKNAQDACTLSIGAAVSGTAPFIYKWIKNDSIIVAGKTDSLWIVPSLDVTDSGSYVCVDSSKWGKDTSRVFRLHVRGLAPRIASVPSLLIEKKSAESCTLSVSASGTGPFTYKWKKFGTILSGKNDSAAALILSNLALADSGKYYCVVSSVWGIDSTPNISLRVQDIAPHIAALPLLLIEKKSAQSCTLAVTVSGTGPFAYKWKKIGGSLAGKNDSASALILANLAISDGGNYYCVVSSPWGVDSTPNIELRIFDVNAPDAPTGLNLTVKTSSFVTLAWSAVTGATTYRLYRDSVVVYDGALLTSTDPTPNAHRYWVTAIKNGLESPRSNVVNTANRAPVWKGEFKTLNCAEGDSVSFVVKDSCSDPDAYLGDVLQYRLLDVIGKDKLVNDSVYRFTAGHLAAGVYVQSIEASDGKLQDTFTLTIRVSATYDTLKVTQTTHGTIAASPSKTAYRWGDTVTISATPEIGYELLNWSGAASGTSQSYFLVMNSNKSISASFVLNVNCTNVAAGANLSEKLREACASSAPLVRLCTTDNVKYSNNLLLVHGRIELTARH